MNCFKYICIYKWRKHVLNFKFISKTWPFFINNEKFLWLPCKSVSFYWTCYYFLWLTNLFLRALCDSLVDSIPVFYVHLYVYANNFIFLRILKHDNLWNVFCAYQFIFFSVILSYSNWINFSNAYLFSSYILIV